MITPNDAGNGRTMQVVRGAKVHSCGDDGLDMEVITERSLSPQDLGAVIFGCTTTSYNECITNKHFGLPFTQVKYVERIEEGLPIFLFNFSEREMLGIFEAVSAAVHVDSSASEIHDLNSRPSFPARVCVRARKDWPIVSLPETIFKEAIIDNYYSYTRFYFELDHKQADELVDLFMRQTIIPPRQISYCHGFDRFSAPQTDVHVVYRESLTPDTISFEHNLGPERYDSSELQFESSISEKPVAQKPYDWDNYSSSLSSESFSFGSTHDQYDMSLYDTPKCGYVPVLEDTITFRLDKVAGKDMIEAGTFSFHHEASQTSTSKSDEDGRDPESTEESSPTATTSVFERVLDNARIEHERIIQQPDKTVDSGFHPQLTKQEEEIAGSDAAITSPPIHEEEALRTGDITKYASVRSGTDEESGEEYARHKPDGDIQQEDEIGPRIAVREIDDGHTHIQRLRAYGQSDSTSPIQVSTANEATAGVNDKPRINEDGGQPPVVGDSRASCPGSKIAAKALSKSNYGAMFSWASEVTRFLSSRGHASRSSERRECRLFLGKLRRLKIMRDESQAQALVHQIQALRVKPANEEFFDFQDSCEARREDHLADGIEVIENGYNTSSIQEHSHATEQEEDLDSQIGESEPTSPGKANEEMERFKSGFLPQSQEEVQFWRSEWMKEAKWRLEDYEHMQNTMFLLENAKRFP
ncbi:hypothetical protein Mp_5g16060 [Marchantia polymorpha subsp. ruderalis]|uniref:DCD domain-containing protein n=2 Tax=Marchantia polymorpha TaxID=3197 RepID=A0AAF6BIV1_MARPO|nr:hypothetical protein MARPO_0071s0004 [Marchantia polymorpha]BBN11935.1 hypothetical protein Mp_5g16060 [Marchantia polymorpha subsp. ruderalis]|eukprot:PTQ35385.1 hypothetical protein MARPO_0071s0004 [Marchantia polymorpha]